MARAYLKILINSHSEDAVLGGLKKIPEVKAADLTMGEQDLIAVIEADTFDDLVQVVLGEVRRVPGITRTITNLAIS